MATLNDLVATEADLKRAHLVLASARAALIECANIIRPQFPSFSDNVIGAHLNEINGVIGNPMRDTDSSCANQEQKP